VGSVRSNATALPRSQTDAPSRTWRCVWLPDEEDEVEVEADPHDATVSPTASTLAITPVTDRDRVTTDIVHRLEMVRVLSVSDGCPETTLAERRRLPYEL
jgi:hypothetical protein